MCYFPRWPPLQANFQEYVCICRHSSRPTSENQILSNIDVQHHVVRIWIQLNSMHQSTRLLGLRLLIHHVPYECRSGSGEENIEFHYMQVNHQLPDIQLKARVPRVATTVKSSPNDIGVMISIYEALGLAANEEHGKRIKVGPSHLSAVPSASSSASHDPIDGMDKPDE